MSVRDLRSSLRRLGRARRGAAALELVLAAGLIAGLSVAIAGISGILMEVERGGRAMDAGLDLVWQLDSERASPSQSEIDAVARAMARVVVADGANYGLRAEVFNADSGGVHGRRWSAVSGPVPPASGATLQAGRVRFQDGDVVLADDEKLVVVTWHLEPRTQGLIGALAATTRTVRALKRDPEIGP